MNTISRYFLDVKLFVNDNEIEVGSLFSLNWTVYETILCILLLGPGTICHCIQHNCAQTSYLEEMSQVFTENSLLDIVNVYLWCAFVTIYISESSSSFLVWNICHLVVLQVRRSRWLGETSEDDGEIALSRYI